eukprot:SAG11_NODE_6734_length_1257_cov_3.475820_1_plen_187_part_00
MGGNQGGDGVPTDLPAAPARPRCISSAAPFFGPASFSAKPTDRRCSLDDAGGGLVVGQEDCLYISVYVPGNRRPVDDLPVRPPIPRWQGTAGTCGDCEAPPPLQFRSCARADERIHVLDSGRIHVLASRAQSAAANLKSAAAARRTTCGRCCSGSTGEAGRLATRTRSGSTTGRTWRRPRTRWWWR